MLAFVISNNGVAKLADQEFAITTAGSGNLCSVRGDSRTKSKVVQVQLHASLPPHERERIKVCRGFRSGKSSEVPCETLDLNYLRRGSYLGAKGSLTARWKCCLEQLVRLDQAQRREHLCPRTPEVAHVFFLGCADRSDTAVEEPQGKLHGEVYSNTGSSVNCDKSERSTMPERRSLHETNHTILESFAGQMSDVCESR